MMGPGTLNRVTASMDTAGQNVTIIYYYMFLVSILNRFVADVQVQNGLFAHMGVTDHNHIASYEFLDLKQMVNI